MEFKYISSKYKNDWENLVKNNKFSGYMQSFWWNEFLNYLGWETFKIGIFDNENIIGGAIISKFAGYEAFNYLQIVHGPVLPYQNEAESPKLFHLLMAEIDKVANLKGSKLSSHLSIEPKLGGLPNYFSSFVKSRTDQEPIKTLIIDLNKPIDLLLAEMKQKGRYNLKIAIKKNVDVVKTDFKTGKNNFLIIYNKFTQRMKFKGKDKGYFDRLAFILTKNIPHFLYFAKYRNKIVATALVIYYGDTATYLYGASSNIYKNVMAPYLLHWQIIKDAKQLRYKKYDFVGLNPQGTGTEHPWYGFSQFKRKFGGAEADYIGAYDYVYNKKLYLEFEKLRKSGE